MEILSLQQLCAHLRLDDERTALAVAKRFGLLPRARLGAKDHYKYGWDNVLRFIHKIEPLSHRDICAELREPLLHFADIATLMGKSSEALRKDVTRGKVHLPPAIQLTDRTRGWRPRDIAAWIEGHPLPVYTAFTPDQPSRPDPQNEPQAGDESNAPPQVTVAPSNPSKGILGDIFAANEAIKLARQAQNTAPTSTAP